jgi:pyrroline-5-carboxylate reductase
MRITILGGGNIGKAIALGLMRSGSCQASDITVTRRNHDLLTDLEKMGMSTGNDNRAAIHAAEIIILAVQPAQVKELLEELRDLFIPDRQVLVSVVTALGIDELKAILGMNIPVVRVMPNTAITICESMTCLAAKHEDRLSLDRVRKIFESLGSTIVIEESLMQAATIIGACGIAFFLRYIRAASQGGIQVGFHADQAQLIAAQTARGAATLLLQTGNHPEDEIDKVTTPRGCTITGLNEMEHNGFSSALIKGIVRSYNEIDQLVR